MIESVIYETLTDMVRASMIVFLLVAAYAGICIAVVSIKNFHRQGIARVQAWEAEENRSAVIIAFPARKS